MAKPSVKNAETIEQEFKDYAYIVSHDLGAPVRAMVEFSKLLQEEQQEHLSDDAKLYLSLVIDNGVKMQRMLKGLLDYSRLNTKPFKSVSLDMNAVLGQCLKALETKVKESKAEILYTQLPSIDFDAERMAQLLEILLENAITYIPGGKAPRIKCDIRDENGNWHMMIEDNGIGIAPQFREKIFKIFQRLHTEEEYPGIGMGLALAQKIVQSAQGKIWFEDALAGGAVVHILLPK